jgi:hypothetical protein
MGRSAEILHRNWEQCDVALVRVCEFGKLSPCRKANSTDSDAMILPTCLHVENETVTEEFKLVQRMSSLLDGFNWVRIDFSSILIGWKEWFRPDQEGESEFEL